MGLSMPDQRLAVAFVLCVFPVFMRLLQPFRNSNARDLMGPDGPLHPQAVY